MSSLHKKYTIPKRKKPIDLSNLCQDTKESIRKMPLEFFVKYSGCGCGPSLEPVPDYRQAKAEVVYKNDRNAWIVLGVDRSSAVTSGYGGACHTQCAAIDLVVGRMGTYARECDEEGEPVYANPDFKIDAARMYVSQKANIDEYFELVEGTVGDSIAQSAIALKADDIRLVARSGIKLVTGTDTRDSQGERQAAINGIDLIAGNTDEDLQPLVKGCNLVNGLTELVEQIEDLREILYSFVKYQRSFNDAALSHTHISPFQPTASKQLDTSPPFMMMARGVKSIIQETAQTELSIISHQTNLATWQQNYLSTVADSYICSAYNNTN